MIVRRLTHQFDICEHCSSFLVRFSTFTKEVVVYHSELTVQRWSSSTVATWPVLPKKQATICFEVLFVVFEGPHDGLLFCFGLIRIDPWAIAGLSEHKSFLRPGVHLYCLEKCPCSILRLVTWRSFIISSRTASMFSGTTAVVEAPPRISCSSESRPRLKLLNQFFQSPIGWCFNYKRWYKSL